MLGNAKRLNDTALQNKLFPIVMCFRPVHMKIICLAPALRINRENGGSGGHTSGGRSEKYTNIELLKFL